MTTVVDIYVSDFPAETTVEQIVEAFNAGARQVWRGPFESFVNDAGTYIVVFGAQVDGEVTNAFTCALGFAPYGDGLRFATIVVEDHTGPGIPAWSIHGQTLRRLDPNAPRALEGADAHAAWQQVEGNSIVFPS